VAQQTFAESPGGRGKKQRRMGKISSVSYLPPAFAPHRLNDFFPLNDPYQHNNDRDHEQNMDEPVDRVAADQSQQPEHHEHHKNCHQHLILLPDRSGTVKEAILTYFTTTSKRTRMQAHTAACGASEAPQHCGSYRGGFTTARRLKDFPALNDPQQHYNNCDHQQDMDEPAHGVTAHQPECLQNQQYYSDRPQHFVLLPD
jgi:hypothetical protein